jgi:hypothetical protein
MFLQQLTELEARLDRVLTEFYYPNKPAVAAAMKEVSPTMKRGEWKRLFGRHRKALPKKDEWLTDPSVRSFKGRIFKAPVNHPDERFKDQYRNHVLPLLDVQKAGHGTVAGHSKVKRAMGFTTNRQGFVSRGEALKLARAKGFGLDDPKAPWRKKAWKGLHSSDMRGRYGPPAS